MADDLKPCPDCGGYGGHRCECWPADCICGWDDDPCDRCDGSGYINPVLEAEEYAYWSEMEARVALQSLRSGTRFNIHQDAPAPKTDPKKARRRALVKAARKQKHGGKR